MKNSIDLVSLEGAQVPGLAQGVEFLQVASNTRIDCKGQIAFVPFLSNGQHGLYFGQPGMLEFVALSGEPALGAPLGANFDLINFNSFEISDSGRWRFSLESTMAATYYTESIRPVMARYNR